MFVVALQTCRAHLQQSCGLLQLLGEIEERRPWPDDVELWIVYNQDCGGSDIDRLLKSASWAATRRRIFPSDRDAAGWPAGPNGTWTTIMLAARFLPENSGVFCIEVDCIPLSLDWLHEIKAAWEKCGRQILGHLEFANGAHFNGNAVYDARLFALYPQAMHFADGVAYDWANGQLFTQIGSDTPLIMQHYALQSMNQSYFEGIKKHGVRPSWFHGIKNMDGITLARDALLKDAQLFIRTWHRDLEWLKVCLQSVRKFWHSRLGTTIVATPECEGAFNCDPLRTLLQDAQSEVHYEAQLGDQRRGSVYIGLTADKYTNSELVCSTDSDCVFTRNCYATDFTNSRGAPIIYMDSFAHLHEIRPGDAYGWLGYKQVIGDCLGIESEYEFMQRHPFIYYRDSIRATRECIEERFGLPLLDIMEKYPSNIFSEFNLLGAYQYIRRQNEKYHFLFKHQGRDAVRQFHSWSEAPSDPHIAAEIEQILR